MNVCSKCESKLEQHKRFCTQCGTFVDSIERVCEQPVQDKKTTFSLISKRFMDDQVPNKRLDDIFLVNITLSILMGVSFLLPWANHIVSYPMTESLSGIGVINSTIFTIAPIVGSLSSFRARRAHLYAHIIAASSM
jgi:hypothetical protein